MDTVIVKNFQLKFQQVYGLELYSFERNSHQLLRAIYDTAMASYIPQL